MIMCGRHAAAREAATECLAPWSLNQAYLLSEALWRQGDILTAMATLASYSQASANKSSEITQPIGSSAADLPKCQSSAMHEDQSSIRASTDCQQQHQHSIHQQQQAVDMSQGSLSSNETGSHEQSVWRSSAASGHQGPQKSSLNEQKHHETSGSIPGSCCADAVADCKGLMQGPPDDISTGSEQPATARASSKDVAKPRSSERVGLPEHRAGNLSKGHQPGGYQASRPCRQQDSPGRRNALDASARCRDLSDFLGPLRKLQQAGEEAQADGKQHLIVGNDEY